MDVPLYAVALAVFAVLYLGIGAFLVYAIMISLMVMFVFLTLRYGNVAQDYPHSGSDVSITAIFIGITWGIFVFVGPKNPIPLIGTGFTYTPADTVPVTAIITIAAVLLIAFLVVFSFAYDKLPGTRATSTSIGPEAPKPKQGSGF